MSCKYIRMKMFAHFQTVFFIDLKFYSNISETVLPIAPTPVFCVLHMLCVYMQVLVFGWLAPFIRFLYNFVSHLLSFHIKAQDHQKSVIAILQNTVLPN